MKLSKKKTEELYDVVSNNIRDARIDIRTLINNGDFTFSKVDDILYKLNINAPEKAIELFNQK